MEHIYYIDIVQKYWSIELENIKYRKQNMDDDIK